MPLYFGWIAPDKFTFRKHRIHADQANVGHHQPLEAPATLALTVSQISVWLCPRRALLGGANDSALTVMETTQTAPRRALLGGSNDSVSDRKLPANHALHRTEFGGGGSVNALLLVSNHALHRAKLGGGGRDMGKRKASPAQDAYRSSGRKCQRWSCVPIIPNAERITDIERLPSPLHTRPGRKLSRHVIASDRGSPTRRPICHYLRSRARWFAVAH